MQTWLLKLGNHLLRKPRFRIWCELEDKKYDVIKAVEQGHGSLPSLIYSYVSTALVIHPIDYSKVYWKDTIDAFINVHRVTVPDTNLPLVSRHSEKKNKKDAWDYSGRLWFFYSNTLASAYGWSVRQIAKLHVNEALAYIQEILTDKQLDREFMWSTTEVAYAYNKQTKKSKFNALERPYWMLHDIDSKEPEPVVKIRKSLLPVGNVQWRANSEAKETELGGDVETLSPSKASD